MRREKKEVVVEELVVPNDPAPIEADNEETLPVREEPEDRDYSNGRLW